MFINNEIGERSFTRELYLTAFFRGRHSYHSECRFPSKSFASSLSFASSESPFPLRVLSISFEHGEGSLCLWRLGRPDWKLGIPSGTRRVLSFTCATAAGS